MMPSPPRRHSVALAALFLVALCGVVAPDSTGVADGPVGTGGIAGIVCAADGLTPLAGITISAEPYADGHGAGGHHAQHHLPDRAHDVAGAGRGHPLGAALSDA